MSVQRYSWTGMSTAEIQAAYDDARAKGHSDAMRSARGALYRRGVRVERTARPPRGSGSHKHPAEFGSAIRGRVENILKAADATRIQIGIQAEDGRTQKEAIEDASAASKKGRIPNLATIAALHEYGTVTAGGRIPQRSFLRTTSDRFKKLWVRGLARVLQEYGAGDVETAVTRLIAIGVQGRDQVQATFRARIPPSLAESTKTKRRTGGGSVEPVPLVFSGQLISSIRSEADTIHGRKKLGGYNKQRGVG